jgi:hypothetical protein
MRKTQGSPLLRTMVEMRLSIFHSNITWIFYVQYLQISRPLQYAVIVLWIDRRYSLDDAFLCYEKNKDCSVDSPLLEPESLDRKYDSESASGHKFFCLKRDFTM